MAEFKQYVATCKFNVALDADRNVVFQRGEDVEFNGTVARYQGEETNLPRLSSAVKVGWLVPANSGQSYRAPSSGQRVRAATPEQEDFVATGHSELAEEERRVSTVEDRQEFRQAAEDSPGKLPQRPAPASKDRGFSVQGEEDGGVAIPTNFSTRAQTVFDGSSSNHGIDPEGVARNAPTFESRTAEVLDSEENMAFEGGDTVYPKQVRKAVEYPEVVLEDHELDDNLDPTVKEGRYQVARLIHPDLPEWDFEEHWTKRLQRIKDLAGNEIALRAIYACESEAIKKRIQQEYDALF